LAINSIGRSDLIEIKQEVEMKIKTFIIIILITVFSLFLSGQTTASIGATTQRADLADATIGQRQDLPSAIAAQSTTINATKTNDIEGLRSSPVMFIENVGQFDGGAQFQVRGGDGTIWLAESALWITVLERSAVGGQLSVNQDRHGALSTRNLQSEIQNRKGVNIKLSFSGANPHPRLEPFDRLETHVSYFIGNDPTKWRADVPVWGGVRYKDLYPGIDLEITSENGHLVQRLVARENVDLEAVQLRVDGADKIELLPSPGGKGTGGEVLRLTTAAGEYTLPLLQVTCATNAKPPRPTIAGNQVASPFTQSPTSNLQSAIQNPQSNDLLYATFLGGSDMDGSIGIAIDSSGAAYVTGATMSFDFPTTPGAFDTNHEGEEDAFVVKLKPSGSALSYATFIGGYWNDRGTGIAIDSNGAAYVTGDTSSSDFPTTLGAFDTNLDGYSDAFVVKLNASGSALSYATFLGGSYGDVGTGIAIDSSGAAYVTGVTDSSDFPITPRAFDTSYNGYNGDAFVVKLNATGSALSYATFLGGSDMDGGDDIAIDSSGAAYVTGRTTSSDFPTTLGAFDPSYNGGDYDAFVVKLNATGSALSYATFLGGNSYECIWLGCAIAIDASGAAYVTGGTVSSDFPTTPGSFDTSYNGDDNDNGDGIGCGDTFVVKLNATGSALSYATFLGGSGSDEGIDIAIDSSGAAYVTGRTTSSDFPITPRAFDTSYNGYNGDVFVVKLNATGSALSYATFLGGSDYDEGYGIALDSSGTAYVTGYTGSSDFPTTPEAFDTNFDGYGDAFVVKLKMVVYKAFLPLVLRKR
jgi:hypothetical protein